MIFLHYHPSQALTPVNILWHKQYHINRLIIILQHACYAVSGSLRKYAGVRSLETSNFVISRFGFGAVVFYLALLLSYKARQGMYMLTL